MKKLAVVFDVDRLNEEAVKIMENHPLHKHHGQLSFTHTTKEYTGKDKWYEGCGSLTFIHGENAFDENGELNKHTIKLTEDDFTEFNEDLKDTYFYEVYKILSADYQIGRMRLMSVPPKKCLSWHADPEERIHVPLITNESCRLVIDDECFHMPADGSAYICDVTKPHTAFNGDHKLKRLNILFDIIGCRNDTVITSLK